MQSNWIGRSAVRRIASAGELIASIRVRALRVCAVAAVTAVAGCTDTVVLTTPQLNLVSNPQVVASPRICIAVTDSDADKRGDHYSRQLNQAIVANYPKAVQSLPPSGTCGDATVTLTIRIVRLGAYFNKTRGSVLSMADVDRVSGNVGEWQPVISAARSRQPAISGTVYMNLPGNWSGIAFIIVEVEDRRQGHQSTFSVSLVAERSGPNDLGYARATTMASQAWDAVGAQLASFLDAAVRKVGAESSR